MLVKVQACISNEDGNFESGKTVDMREGVAHQWIKNRWAVDPTGRVYLSAAGELIFRQEEKPERTVIETPEANMTEPETAVIRTRGRPKKLDE